MTSNPFDRTVWNLREKPLSPDWNRALTQGDYALRLLAREMYASRNETTIPAAQPSSAPSSGFVGLGVSVQPQATPSMSVVLKAGVGFADVPTDVPTTIGGVVSLDDAFSYKPMVLLSDLTIAVPAAPISNSRIDLIEVRPNRQFGDPQTRLILDPTSGAFNPNSVNKTLSWTLDGSMAFVNDPAPSTTAVGYKQGAAAASPVAPSVTPGYLPVAYVSVASFTTSITFAQISDQRRLLFPGSCAPWSALWTIDQTVGSGTGTITPIRVSAPPGIQVGCFNSANANAYQVIVLGGKLQSCPMTFSVGVSSVTDPSEAGFSGGFIVAQASNAEVRSPGGVTSPIWSSLPAAGGGPAINAGPLSSYARAYINFAAQNNGTTVLSAPASSGPGVNLQHVTLAVHGVCRW